MKEIEIEDDIYKYILANIEAFGETPSQILRRLLALPEHAGQEKADEKPTVTAAVQQAAAPAVIPQNSPSSIDSRASLPAAVAHGVGALFAHQAFKEEPVITNKFKMMLTAMYHENRAAFIAAANMTRGRTRDYFGQNLSTLLASDNKEEVAQLKASKPRDIPYTPFWVITNANTGRKRIILTQMMTAMGYPDDLIARIKDEI